MTAETTCAICSGPLTQTTRNFGSLQNRNLTRPGQPYCSNGCTDTPDYYNAKAAREAGEAWAPKEPAHCGVSMSKTQSGMVVNNQRGVDAYCQICSYHEWIATGPL